MLEQTAIHVEQRVQSSPDSISAEVIYACQQGDREAFRLLFEAYRDRVFSIACYQLGYGIAAFGIGPLRSAGLTLPEIYGASAAVAAVLGLLSVGVARGRPSPSALHRPASHLK